MAKIVVRHDAESNSLDIWFGEPSKESICEEVEDGLILKKDKAGNTIGIEILNWLPVGTWKIGESVEIDTGLPLAEAQEKIRRISEKFDKEMVHTSAFFITLLNGQLGSLANKYLAPDGGRKAEGIEIDIADMIVCSLAYLNWLRKDASEAFAKALKKHEDKIMELNKTPRTSRSVAKVHVGVDDNASKPEVTPEMIERAWESFRKELGIRVS